MSISVLTETYLRRLVPSGTPLFGVPYRELLTLPLFVVRYAVKARSVSFRKGLAQIQWIGTLDDDKVVLVWHVRGNRAMIAHRSSLKVVSPAALLAALRRSKLS